MSSTLLYFSGGLRCQKKAIAEGPTEPQIENPQICPYMSIYGYIEKQKKDLYIDIDHYDL
jgi:hypothetical protein